MNQGSTLLLRLAVLAMGVAVLSICVLVLPSALKAEDDTEYRLLLWGLYVTAVPFFVALFQTLKILDFIDKNKAFTNMTVRALKKIKLCAIIIGVLYVAELPILFKIAEQEDAPGVFAIGLIIVFASSVVSVFAAVLQQVLRSAIAMKAEHDLTV